MRRNLVDRVQSLEKSEKKARQKAIEEMTPEQLKSEYEKLNKQD